MNLYEKAIGQRSLSRYNLAQRFRCIERFNPHMASSCKHPRVRVVSRQDDIEFVECVECGEVFDSDEFRDMEIEEKGLDPADEEEE